MFPDLLVTLSFKEFLVYIDIIARAIHIMLGAYCSERIHLKLSYVSDLFVSDRSMDNSDYQLDYSDDERDSPRWRGEYSDEESESSGSRRSQESESENDNCDLALYNLPASFCASLTWKLVRADSLLTSMHIYC